ncbi:hypothetical protein B0T17DRAFT_540195 [Bombardia bombarda]|uniref:Rhodopsin domain-containing protein n=1 Tax=Bombardia bombarda TaxID=252184 RepID=A0AA39WIP8_9PEZI|nr:hypothetical protein B0T17DRAFT_540195 [Bombardia bombarda]
MASVPPGVDLCKIPAGRPPAGVTPNLTNPESLDAVTYSVCLIMTVWAVSFATARVYVNWHKLKLADYFMIIATILTITYTALILTLAPYNRHQWNVPACWFTGKYIKTIYAQVTLVGPVLFFSKCAIFLMFRQLFEVHRSIQICVWIGMVATFLIYFPSIPLSAIFEAPRRGQSWEDLLRSLSAGNGLKLVYWGIVQGSCSVALDLYIFVMPLPILSRLHLPFAKKMQLLAVFGTALIGVAASVIALVYRIELLGNDDSTWQQACLAVCVVAENNVAIVVGSMPAFANFMRLHVAELPTIRSLRSKLWSGSSNDKSGFGSSGEVANPVATFGSPQPRKPAAYYELTESAIMRSQFTTVHEEGVVQKSTGQNGNESGNGIVRTMDIFQQSRRRDEPQSTDHLV